MDSMIQLTAGDGHSLDAYEVRPDGASSAIVIVQEIFGVNPHIRSLVDRYAALGYHAVAPALFDRVRKGVELDYDAAGVTEGRELAGAIRFGPAMTDVAAAVEHASATGPVAVIGYCFGGSVAWLAACDLPIAAAVGYYGGQIRDHNDRTPKAPTMLHFGALDHAIPLEAVAEITAAHPDVTVHVYDDAEHGFACDARASYHAESAALALERTLAFLGEHDVTAGGAPA